VSRRILICNQTWQDRKFEKAFKKLDAKKQRELLEKLADLSSILARVPHPASHPELQKYRPTANDGVAHLKGGGKLLEYRLEVSRVIAKHPACAGSDDVLLLAITVDHDHDRLKALIQQHRSEIDGWREDEA